MTDVWLPDTKILMIPLRRKISSALCIEGLSTLPLQNVSLRAGFEPAREDPIGFQVQRLNHSAITAAVLESKLKQARCLPASAMDWIITRLVFNALWADWLWNKNYPDWLSLQIALWTHIIRIELWPVKPTLCYSMSCNPHIFLTVVPLTIIYALEDINWSRKSYRALEQLNVVGLLLIEPRWSPFSMP